MSVRPCGMNRQVARKKKEPLNQMENSINAFLQNIDKVHTTDLGIGRIKKNLKNLNESMKENDVVEWCRKKIADVNSTITRKGKNWYVKIDDCVITVNACSYTIITAHKQKE